MAERAAIVQKVSSGLVEVRYDAALTEADTCEAVDITAYGPVFEVALYVTGTFGAGGSIALQGSGEKGGTFTALNDLAGAAIAQTGAGIVDTESLTRYMRPAVGAGTGVSVTPVLQIFLR